MFKKESGLVQIWFKQVQTNPEERENVPKLSNLQEVVFALLDGENDA